MVVTCLLPGVSCHVIISSWLKAGGTKDSPLLRAELQQTFVVRWHLTEVTIRPILQSLGHQRGTVRAARSQEDLTAKSNSLGNTHKYYPNSDLTLCTGPTIKLAPQLLVWTQTFQTWSIRPRPYWQNTP